MIDLELGEIRINGEWNEVIFVAECSLTAYFPIVLVVLAMIFQMRFEVSAKCIQ